MPSLQGESDWSDRSPHHQDGYDLVLFRRRCLSSLCRIRPRSPVSTVGRSTTCSRNVALVETSDESGDVTAEEKR